MRIVRILALLLVIAGLAAGGLVWSGKVWLDTPLTGLVQPSTFEVQRGATLRSVATALQQRGIIDRPTVWVVWGRLTHQANNLKAGEYELQPGMNPRAVLALLSSGQVVLHSITFIEGSTFTDVRNAL